MEIFQTIWTALTTENELLTKFILIPSVFIENILNVLIFCTLLNISCSKQNKTLYILTVSSLGNIFNLIIPNPYRSFVNLFLMILCIKLFFKTNILKTILSLIIPILVTVLCESIITKVFSSVIDFNSLTLVNVPIYRLLVTFSIELLEFLVYLLIRYSKLQISLLENMSINGKIMFILNLTFALIAMIVHF